MRAHEVAPAGQNGRMTHSEDILVIPVEGDLDVSCVGRLRALIDERVAGGCRRVILNMSQASYVDSLGMSLIFAESRQLRERGGLLSLVNVRDNVYRRDPHEMFTLDEQSGVVGAFRGMTYHDGRVRLREGDRLLLYTDGVTEARNPSGAFFGEQGLRDAVMEEAAGDYEHMLDRLLARLDAFTERSLDDDVAMVTLRFDELGGE